jgi:YVTN family beta-propeller protein
VVTLNGPERTPIDLTAELTGLTLHAQGGGWFQIPMPATPLNSLEVVRQQIPLVDASLPAGRYDRLTLKFSKATLRQEGKVVDLSVPAEGFTLDVSLEIEPSSLVPLFITWDIERAVEREVFLAPAFTIHGKEPEIRAVVAYVTNEESGTVSVLDRVKNQVVSTIQMGRAPRGIVVEPDTRRAFVLNGGADTITVIDVNTNRSLHTFNLESQARPHELAISPLGRTLYVANTGLNSVSAIDAASLGVTATIPVGISPVSLALDPRATRVLVANQGSNTVSLIDTFSNRVVGTMQVDLGPVHISTDPNPNVDRAYVASPTSAFMTVLAASTGQVLRRLSVGPGVVASLPDDIPNRLFLVKTSQNRVVVFDAGLNVEIGGFQTGKSPFRIVRDPDRDKLYVVNREGDSVTVVDRLSRRVEATIPVGKRPYGIAIVR